MKEDVLCVTEKVTCISIIFLEARTGGYQHKMVAGVGFAQDTTI